MMADLYLLVPPMLNPLIHGMRTNLTQECVLSLLWQKGTQPITNATWEGIGFGPENNGGMSGEQRKSLKSCLLEKWGDPFIILAKP